MEGESDHTAVLKAMAADLSGHINRHYDVNHSKLIVGLPTNLHTLIDDWVTCYMTWLVKTKMAQVYGNDDAYLLMLFTVESIMLERQFKLSRTLTEFGVKHLDSAAEVWMDRKESPLELFAAMAFLYQDPESPWFVEMTENAIEEFRARQPSRERVQESIEYKVGLKLAEIRDQYSSWLESFVMSNKGLERTGIKRRVPRDDFWGRWRNVLRKFASKTNRS